MDPSHPTISLQTPFSPATLSSMCKKLTNRACDRMDRLQDKHAEDPLKEIATMELIGNKHPNVMGAIEVLFDGTHSNVVMPCCGSGDMFELLQDTQRAHPDVPRLPEPAARHWFQQVLKGVQHLHSKAFVIATCHRKMS
jgi:serine/threonine protein kinase